MRKDLTVFNDIAKNWLRILSQQQALFCIDNISTFLNFANKHEDFFQGCGLYVVGSSVNNEKLFNDIDIVLVGLDFRAVVKYDRIFLMDPEVLIEKNIIVEPRLFSVLREGCDEGDDGTILKPVTQCTSEEGGSNIEAWGRRGLKHAGIWYDYNVEQYTWSALNLTGYCSYHATSSSLVNDMYNLFSLQKDKLNAQWSECPFENYGFGSELSFLVYHFSVDINTDLPTIHKDLLDVKPIDFCIHAENLQLEEWKRHQRSLGLPYVTLKEWPKKHNSRKIITDLEHPAFIDPQGICRAKADIEMMPRYKPKKPSDIIDI